MLHILQIDIGAQGKEVKLGLSAGLEKLILRNFPQNEVPLAVLCFGCGGDLYKLCIAQNGRIAAAAHITITGGDMNLGKLPLEHLRGNFSGRMEVVASGIQGQVFNGCAISQRNRPCPRDFFHVISFPNSSLYRAIMFWICSRDMNR